MATYLNPYLNFLDGKAREAMEFYRSVLGGELQVMTFGDMGQTGPVAKQVMHSCLTTPTGLMLMGADAPAEFMEVTVGNNFSVSLSGDDEAELTRWFEGLTEGSTVVMPLGKQPWGDVFGHLTDRYGINWLVNISTPA